MAEDQINVTRIAELARIAVTPEETALYQSQLEHILGYIDKLKEVDVEGIRPEESLPLGPLRADEARPGIGQEAVMANAPDSANGQIRVPKVVDPT